MPRLSELAQGLSEILNLANMAAAVGEDDEAWLYGGTCIIIIFTYKVQIIRNKIYNYPFFTKYVFNLVILPKTLRYSSTPVKIAFS